MRGVIAVFLIAVFLVVYMLGAPAAVEGVGEAVKDQPIISDAQAENIDAFYDSLFMWIPLVLMFGMAAWAVVWYVRQQLIIGRV